MRPRITGLWPCHAAQLLPPQIKSLFLCSLQKRIILLFALQCSKIQTVHKRYKHQGRILIFEVEIPKQVQFMMLWSALILGDASFDKHQLEDFLQMCVMTALGEDIWCLGHYHHHLILLTFRCNSFVCQCVCACVSTLLRDRYEFH